MNARGNLGVSVDGTALAVDEARAFWRRFNRWMEDHFGDLAGFAAAEGFTSVRPEVHDGVPVLVASRTAPQQPYAPAPAIATKRTGAAGRRRRRR
jgi:hypothetical protein